MNKPTDTNRTDFDRVAFVEKGRYDIQHEINFGVWYIYDNELKDGALDSADFGSWREAVDALMDLSENEKPGDCLTMRVAPGSVSEHREALQECWELVGEAERDEINIRDEMEKWERAYGHLLGQNDIK